MNGVMTPQEVADRLKLNKDTVLRLIRSGKLPAVKIGSKTYRITEDALAAFMRGEQPKTTKNTKSRKKES
jgi:excisionase family DNA binding protein